MSERKNEMYCVSIHRIKSSEHPETINNKQVLMILYWPGNVQRVRRAHVCVVPATYEDWASVGHTLGLSAQKENII